MHASYGSVSISVEIWFVRSLARPPAAKADRLSRWQPVANRLTGQLTLTTGWEPVCTC